MAYCPALAYCCTPRDCWEFSESGEAGTIPNPVLPPDLTDVCLLTRPLDAEGLAEKDRTWLSAGDLAAKTDVVRSLQELLDERGDHIIWLGSAQGECLLLTGWSDLHGKETYHNVEMEWLDDPSSYS